MRLSWNRILSLFPYLGKKTQSRFGKAVFGTRLFDDPIVIYLKRWSLIDDETDPANVHVNPVVGMLADQEVVWLVTVPWSAEDKHALEQFDALRVAVAAIAPKHRIIIIANTRLEYDMLQRAGFETLLANQNQFADPEVYKPLEQPGERPFDAVYNARFRPYKRHELATSVKRLSLVGYTFGTPEFDAIADLFDDAHFANHRDGKLRRLTQAEVNVALNQARVGLCLSEVEGAMMAAVEYLLAGLPVVTTPSRGGRDIYFDDRFVRVVEPEPEAVARAVQSFVEEDISPEFIRAETLKKLKAANEEFLTDLSQMLAISRDDLAETFHERFNHGLALMKHRDKVL